MKRNEICYIVVVAVIGVSLLLGFAEEVFGLDMGSLSDQFRHGDMWRFGDSCRRPYHQG